MIAGAAIDAEPFDLLLQHPLQQFDFAARMHAEIAHQVLLRLALPVSLPAGVDDEDIALLDLDGSALDHFRSDHRPVVHVLRDVDHSAGTHQEIERIGGHVAHAVGAVHGAVDMGADVQRGVDPLRDDHLGLQVLSVIHLIAGITDPAGRVHIHQMSEIDDFHCDTCG